MTIVQTPKATLVDRALRDLEEHFVTLQLPPGTVWTESALSESLKIGRTPVREAVLRMAMDGLVTVIPRAGILISNISVENQLLVLETRRGLERVVSLRAAHNASGEERGRLRTMADGIERAGERQDVRSYIAHHFAIKRFVAQCARNAYAVRALRPLHTLSQRFYFAFHQEFDNLPQVGVAHARLTRAIAEGDAAAAGACSDAVCDIADNFTLALLTKQRRTATG